MRKIFLLLIIVSFMFGCQNKSTNNVLPESSGQQSKKRQQQEIEGQVYLTKARNLMMQKEYAVAAAQIDSLRKHCRLAFTAREEGILLLDSINLFETEDELVELDERMKVEKDSVEILKERFEELFTKAEFYRRKMEYDRNKSVHR